MNILISRSNCIAQAVITFIFISLLSCTNDPSSPKNEEENTETPKTVTIGISGGTIEKNDFKLIIPTGAFDGNYDITVSEVKDDGAFGENKKSLSYSIGGLPTTFNQSIKIAVKHNGELSEYNFIAIGNEFYNELKDTTSTIYDLFQTKDSAGYLITEILEAPSVIFFKSNSQSKISVDNRKRFVSIVDLTKTYETKHFIIKYPIFLAQDVVELGENLESVFEIIINKFHYFNEDTNPINVVICNQKISADYISKEVSANKFSFTINISRNDLSIKNYKKIRTGVKSVFVDFPITTFYTTLKNRTWTTGTYQWLRIAFHAWAEKYFNDDPNFKYSENFEKNALAPFNGFQSGSSFENEIYLPHGYGMASLIEYLVKNTSFGMEGFINTYRNIKSDFDPLSSLFTNVDGLFIEWFADYYKKLINNEIYELPKDYFIKNSNIIWNVNSENDSLKVFNAQDPNVDTYLNLSAKLFKININYKPTDETYKMRLSVLGPVDQFGLYFHVFGIQNNELTFIESIPAINYYEIPSLKNSYDKFLVCVVNGLGNSPYIGESDIDFKVQIGNNFDGGDVQADLDFNLCRIEVYLQGLWKDTRWAEGTTQEVALGVSTYHDYYDYEDTVRTISGSFYGNVFTGSFDNGEGWTQTATVTLNDQYNSIIDYSFEEINTTSYGYVYKRKVSGSNVPVSSKKNSLFEIKGTDACSGVFNIQSKTIINGSDSSQVIDHWCNENSRVIIQFYKN
jgi:hypothetical protein